jgi:hypothetical protein
MATEGEVIEPLGGEKASSPQHDTISIDDWSRTGRGSHVEFGSDENVPLEQGEETYRSGSQLLTADVKGGSLGEVQWETFMKSPSKDTSLLTREWLSSASLLAKRRGKLRY